MKQEDYKKIILVDDHIIVRNGLHELIEKLGPYQIIQEYNNGKEFVEAIIHIESPDLVIMDLTMPEMNGDEVIEWLATNSIKIPILILTLNHDEKQITKLFRQGICGYLEKNCTALSMKEALSTIFKSGFFYNEFVSLAFKEPIVRKTSREIALGKLTEREKQFLELVCHEDEYTYDQIASKMGVVVRTVDGYRESIFFKFDIKSKAGLVGFAIKNGLHTFD